MQVQSKNFVSLADISLADESVQEAVNKGTNTAYNKRLAAMYAFGEAHGEALRAQGAEAKRRALRQLPELLEQADANMTENGMNVLWAEDAAEVRRMVMQIATRHEVTSVTKSKSMVTEEVGLNDALVEADLEVIETDLGEWILQLNDEPPSHIVTPVIHKTKQSIVDVFREHGYTGSDDANEMATYAREKLRAAFMESDMGISGGNFIIAETGSIGLVMNEGNGRMVTSLPNIHIAIVGLEKVVETIEDYTLLTQLISRSGTGQNMTVYNHTINGPRRPDEDDGPEHVYVIFVDNGRSDIYATDYAEALACIRCGACLNACPVYQNTGGHAYGWVYGGPIGAVVTPLLTGLENASPLPYASTLCGACKTACPVDIDIPRMLLDLRRDITASGGNGPLWDVGLLSWSVGNRSAWLYEVGGAAARTGQHIIPKNNLPGILGNWTKYRDFPEFANKPFRELWKDRENGHTSNGEEA